LEKHHHHSHPKQHRGSTHIPSFVEVSHKAHAMKIEPCYPPPCPGYEYDLSQGQLTEQGTVTPGPGGGTGVVVPGDGGTDDTGSNSDGGNNNSPTDTGTQQPSETPTPLPPDTPVAGTSTGPAPGASGAVYSSSSAANWWIQIPHAPKDPKAGQTDLEGGGCCNPALAADRAKMLELQKKIDAQTEIRAGHIKWMQDAEDAIAKVLRQIAATNETVFELTQDISVLETQIDQIRKKIRADKLKADLENAQDELEKIKDNESSVEVQKDKVSSQQAALIEKIGDIKKQIARVPHQNVELVAAKYDPSQQS